MGQVSSRASRDTVDCYDKTVSADNFLLQIKKNVFDDHFFKSSKSVNISVLGFNGTWHSTRKSLEKKAYSDRFVTITPDQTLVIKESGQKVQLLELRDQKDIESVLCSKSSNGVEISDVYVRLVLARHPIAKGTYKFKKDFIILCPSYLLIVHVPDVDTLRVPNVAYTALPNLLIMAQSFLRA